MRTACGEAGSTLDTKVPIHLQHRASGALWSAGSGASGMGAEKLSPPAPLALDISIEAPQKSVELAPWLH
jgi:hypothetical protein